MPQPTQQVQGTHVPSPADEGVVLRRIAEGDVAALGLLFDQMARPVYSLAMQLLRNHDAAEDIVESTFWQAWQESGHLLGSDAQGWLLEMGRRRALNQLHSRRRQREELLQDKRQFSELVTAPGEEASGSESEPTFMHRLCDLPREERQVLELGYFRGLSQADIVELTGEPANTIRERMRSALEKLRVESGEEVQPE